MSPVIALYTVSVMYAILYRMEERGYIEVSSTVIVDGRALNYYGITPRRLEYLMVTLSEFKENSDILCCQQIDSQYY